MSRSESEREQQADGAAVSRGVSRGGSISRLIRRIIVVVLLVVFVGSACVIGYTYYQYGVSDSFYEQAAKQFTSTVSADGSQRDGDAAPTSEASSSGAPISVDFASLKQVNEDVVGWIYCEGTPLNYPVLKGTNNDEYLHADYTHSSNLNGSIFVDSDNEVAFGDANTIVYGHHMNQGAMFAVLEQWAQPGFYEQHPLIWLLTPEGDYAIQIFSGHHARAGSDWYDIITEPGDALDAFLARATAESDFVSSVELDPEARYVMLSTCAYVFDDARYVLHGKLVAAP